MSLFPFTPVLPLFISTYSGRFSAVAAATSDLDSTVNPAAAAWPVANTAYYTPIVIPFTYPVKRVWWVNGGTVTANADFGIFDAITGKKIASTGSTAQSGANLPQYVNLDILLLPGEYFFGLSLSLNTASMFRTTLELAAMRLCGWVQETSAVPLPATMTPALLTNNYVPYCGITRTSSGF